MESKPDIEEQVNAALQSARKIQPVELPFGFSDRIVNKLHTRHTNNVRSLYTLSPVWRIAAMFVLIIVNLYTLKLALSAQPQQSPSQYATIKDFVKEYQIYDNNEEILTTNTPTHEQP